jgi:hypothetical protein
MPRTGRLIRWFRGIRRPAEVPPVEWGIEARRISHEVGPEFRDAFIAAGYRARDFFPHRIRYLPKCGPDGVFLAKGMTGSGELQSLWQVVIHATPPSIDEFPREVFFDRDLLWHQQHFHEVGQVASATVKIDGSVMYTMAHQSDLVQRISRRRELKTRVENVFRGWHHLLLNAIVHFAHVRGCREVRVPTSHLMMRFTDRKRTVQAPLFERVYDRAVMHHFDAREVDSWWCIDVDRHRGRIVTPERRVTVHAQPRTICLVHDTERSLGHPELTAGDAAVADAASDAALNRMLEIERAAGVRATYVVVGTLMRELRDRIELDNGTWRSTAAGGHALGFHSHDHTSKPQQIGPCRSVDYRIKGYRPPKSELTAELTDETLGRYNFEWLASSSTSLGFTVPRVSNRVAKLPIHFDDYPLQTGRMTYDPWRRRVAELAASSAFTAIGLHDCYAGHWLPRYSSILDDLGQHGVFRTLDEVADELFLASAD